MLTEREIDILIEALREWERKDDFGNLLDDMVGAVFYKEGTDEFNSYKEKTELKKRQKKEQQKLREETSIIIKAKLIQAKQDKAIEKLFND